MNPIFSKYLKSANIHAFDDKIFSYNQKILQYSMLIILVFLFVLFASLLLWKIDLINAKFFVRFTKQFNMDTKNEKCKLFTKVNKLAKEAGSDSKLKVLEIGGGTGANFEFIGKLIF